MKKLFYSTLFLIVFGISAIAQKNGGMWIPTELNEKEMKELGLEISVSDIFNTTRPSIKDAIVQFGGGCTGEIISPRGLVLTNHHCGYGEIQAHSSVDNDLLSNGFWAKNNSEELPNPDLSVTFVVEIHNVSEQILAGTSGLSDEEQAKVIEKNIDSLRKNFPHKAYQNIIVKPVSSVRIRTTGYGPAIRATSRFSAYMPTKTTNRQITRPTTYLLSRKII